MEIGKSSEVVKSTIQGNALVSTKTALVTVAVGSSIMQSLVGDKVSGKGDTNASEVIASALIAHLNL